MKGTIFIFTAPVAGRETDYNTWYDEIHLPALLELPGFVAGQRFEHVPTSAPGTAPPAGYLAVYDVDDDPAVLAGGLLEKLGTGEIAISDSVDMTSVALWAFSSAGERA